MNKKIFAALASATMALSATGSLAVFAEDFDVTTEAVGDNGVGIGVVIPNSGIAVNTENFPDDAFREDIMDGSVIKDKDGNSVPFKYGEKISKAKLESVTEITFDAGVKDTTGVKYFTNLVTASTDGTRPGTNALKTADLSENSKLETVDFVNVPDLTTLNLPKTNKVENVTVIGGAVALPGDNPIYPAEYVQNPAAHAPINELDLSSNKGLEKVVIVATNITKLDLSNNGYLTYVNVANNKINTLDLTNNYVMQSLYCNNNELYSLDVPNTDKLIDLVASYNILQELDLTGLTGVQNLFVNDNELRHIDLSESADLVNLNVAKNHLGSLDLSSNKALHGITINPQVVYIDSSFDGVNLPDSFPEMDKDEVVADSSVWTKKTGILTVEGNNQTYRYNTGCMVTSPDLTETLEVIVLKESVLNRLYNPNSGEHFYTSDVEEKDTLVGLGWQDEGIGWTAPTKSNTPVYRLYNPNAGDHHYTASASERDILVSVGWKFEGTGWYSYTESINYPGYDTKEIASIDVVREYNPNAKAAGAHNYTVNHAENDFLVSVGWLDEGVAWKAMK